MQGVSMSSGDCANYPHNRHLLLNRLRRRVENCKQHTQDCQTRQHTTQHMRSEVDRMNTALLMQKVQENKLKKTGKYKNDVRPKPVDQSSDSSDYALNKLKRKLENSTYANNGQLVKQGSLLNGCDPNMTPSANGLPTFMTNQQYDMNSDAETKAKKMKMDSEQQQQQQQHYHGNQGNNNQPGNNNCNNGNVSSLSVQIVHQINNEQQRRIETTVNVNTSSNAMGNGDTQSVSVNVGPKDIKQEMNQDSSQTTHSTVVNSNVTQSSQEQPDDGMPDAGLGGITDLINDSDFESWFEEFTQNPTEEDGLPDFGIATGDAQQPPNQQPPPSMDQSNVLKDNQFQCKTEKVDFGFGGEATSNNNASNNQQQYFNPEMQSNPMFNNQAPSYNEKTSSPFTHSTMTQQSISMNQQQNVNSGNGQMTSQHIHRLSVSVNSKFNVMQKQQQPHNGMNNNRTPSNENEPMRTTPDAPPRLSHPPSANMAKSVSPSPVSYSVTHQPHPGLNSIPNGQTNGGPYFSSAMQNAPMTGSMPQNPNLQRAPRMPIQGTPSYMNQRGGNAGLTMGPGINSGMGPAPPNPTGMSKAQQLKELAEKRGPAGINNQWSASASASVNMSSSMSYNGQSLNQRDHMSADMQSFTSFQNSNVNNVSQSQVNMQSNNYMAASVAAQAAVAASHRQQQHPPYTQGSRLSHFNNLEGNFQPNQGIPNPRMMAKSMYSSGVPMNPNQMQAAKSRYMQRTQPQQIMRAIRPGSEMVTQERTPGMAYYNRQMEQKYCPSATPSGQMMNNSASVNMRIQQSASISTNQRHMRQYMMEQYQMNVGKPTSMSPHNAGVPHPRGPSPLSRQMITHQQSLPQHQMQNTMTPMQSRIPANTQAMYQNQNGNNWAAGQPTLPQDVAAPSPMPGWNRGSVPSGASINKLPGYTRGINPQTPQATHSSFNGYTSPNSGGQHRPNPGIPVPSNCNPQAGQMLNQTSVQSNQLSQMNGMQQHQQHNMFQSSMPSNNTNQNNFGMMNGLNSTMFESPNSPNTDLTLIDELLDGK